MALAMWTKRLPVPFYFVTGWTSKRCLDKVITVSSRSDHKVGSRPFEGPGENIYIYIYIYIYICLL